MSGSRVGNSLRNIVYRITSQIISIILKFVSRTIFVQVLGVEYLGINGLFSEILTMLSLADLGFGTAMVFSMYKPLAENDQYKLSQLIMFYKKIYRIIAVVISVIGVLLIPLLPYIVNLESEIPHLRIYYILYLANTVSSYLVVYKTCILNADQKNYILSKYDMIFNFLSMIGCSIFLVLTRNFMIYLVVQVIFTYAKNFYCSYVTEKRYPFINNKVTKISKKESKAIFENIKSVFIYKFATTLVNSIDNTLISILISTVVVGYYSNYNMIISTISVFINIIFSSVTASLGNLIVEKDSNKNYQVYKTMQFVSFVLSTASIATLYIVLDDFIKIWLGENFVLDKLVLIAMIINMYFSIVLMPIWSYREATGMYRQTKYVMLLTALINFVLSVVLGKNNGLAGILIATSIARISTYFWYEPKLLFAQFFKEKVSNYYISIVFNIVITIVVIIVDGLLFSGFEVNTWGKLILKTIFSVIISFILTLLLYCKHEEFSKLKSIVKVIFKCNK